ncbi:MAG: radical SAM protein [Alphaproteobacteria bacterium]|nr:radical SAM protein [Alphaproteobacteria bacterium]MCB9791184.1 radical SAM protein [Alphaproteobacteria bacterium]
MPLARQESRSAQLRRRARAWRNIATSATMARVDPEWVPRPHAGHFIVTYRCNLKCLGCPSWEVTEHQDLTLEEWRAVFRQLRSLDIVKVLGGEPFVRKDIVDILASVREIVDPYILQLTTNGMLTRRAVEAIDAVAWPGLQLRISVDGTEPTHDRMRGVEGSWRIVTRTAREIAELKAKHGFKFGINFAVTDQSVHELDEMLAFAESLGADLIPGVNVDPFLVGTVPPEVRLQQVIMVEDKERALKALEDSRVGTRRQLPLVDHLLSRLITRNTFEHQIHGRQHRFPCRELSDLIYVLPNGDLVRCGMDHEPVGNLRETRFDDIWYGEDIRAYRQKVRDCPGCLQASVQIMSRLYGGCFLA